MTEKVLGKRESRKNIRVGKSLVTGASFLLAFLLLQRAGSPLDGALCFGLFAAGLFLNFGNFTLPFVYLLSNAAQPVDLIFSVLFQAAFLCAVKYLHAKFRWRFRKWAFLGYLFAAQTFYLLFELTDSAELFRRLMSVAAGILFAFVCLTVLKAVVLRGLKYKLAADEWICLGAAAVCLLKGVQGVAPFGADLLRTVTAFGILFCLNVFREADCFRFAAAAGLAEALNTGDLTAVGVYTLWAVAAVCFRTPRYLAPLAVCLTDVAAGFLFEAFTVAWQPIAACALGCLMFLCLSERKILWLKDKLGINENPYAARHIVNKQRTNLSRKLYELSEIFFQMQSAFKSMVKGTLPMDKAKIALSRDVSEKVCRDCPERQNCWRTHIEETETDFIAAVGAALNRGRATILDLAPALTSRCRRTANLLNEINRSVSVYKQYYSITTNADTGRLLIGDQMGGVSQIFKSLSLKAGDKLQFNTEKEKEIMEELTYQGVLTKEVVFCVEGGKISLTLVVAAKDFDGEKIENLLSKLCRTGLTVREKEFAADDHWVVATLEPEANFSVTFGFHGVKKQGSESSGDTHSFLRIADDKVLVALCDGMGSGAEAEQASSTAISLVENFYKAGFDNDLILNSVNRLLSIENGETFTAVDICVLDLKNGAGDFIKIGAPYGVVKLADDTELIRAGSLPMGVLEEMKPIITRKTLSHGDCVLLASDGFMDCFDDANEVAQLVHDREIVNPQEAADELMRAALQKCGNVPKDDMTVVVARLN